MSNRPDEPLWLLPGKRHAIILNSGLQLNQKAVLHAIAAHMWRNEAVYISHTTIGRQVSRKRRQVIRIINDLVERKIVIKTRRDYDTCLYEIDWTLLGTLANTANAAAWADFETNGGYRRVFWTEQA